MLQQHGLDLYSSNIFPASANDILESVDKKKRAVGADANDVARVKPAALSRRVRGCRILVIATEKQGARV